MKPTPAPPAPCAPAPRPVPMGLLYTISRHRLGMSSEQALDFVDACVDFAGDGGTARTARTARTGGSGGPEPTDREPEAA